MAEEIMDGSSHTLGIYIDNLILRGQIAELKKEIAELKKKVEKSEIRLNLLGFHSSNIV